MPENLIETNDEQERIELGLDPGEIAPCWASPYPEAELTEKEENELVRLCQLIADTDMAARRWEVVQAWEMRLFDRGYQHLWRRRGGGWIYLPFNGEARGGRGAGEPFPSSETNIIATYGEILTAALTRDIPAVRFFPENACSDADITAKDAATGYARIFARDNDLMDLQQQLVYYLRTDGRALIVVDHVIDAQRFGRRSSEPENVVPETETMETPEPVLYLLRHGETEANAESKARGRSEAGLDEKGIREVRRACEWLKGKNVQRILCSPVERSMESAQLASSILGVPYEADDRLASLDIGGLTGEDSQKTREDMEEAFENPEQPIAGGETPEEFSNRVGQALMDALSSPQQPVLMISHDSVISETFKILEGDEMPVGDLVEPGWVAQVEPNPDGTFRPMLAYPFRRPEESSGEQRGAPRGREVVRSYGKLEHRVPMNAQDISECLWIQLAGEYDVALVKAMFPKKAEKIKTGGTGEAESQLDRVARVNSMLALEASYVATDSMNRDCTVQRTWLRPGMFMQTEDEEVRASLLSKFHDGALVIQAGGTFVMARQECMDDHLTLVHAWPGTGMNRLSLCSKLLPIQKMVNNWIDLLNQYFLRAIPMRYIAQGPFDVAAIQNQGAVVGGYIPFLLDDVPPNRAVSDLIWQEPFPTMQPVMPEAIKMFLNELPQMISHALPSLFGAASNTDTVGGITIQRDQALGCLGTPWHSIKAATARYFKQAVRMASLCRKEPIEGFDPSGKLVRVELASLKGNVLAYPEESASFPESWVQKQSRYQQLIADAANPLVQKILGSIGDLRLAKDMAGFEELKVPGADSYEKQMGEFEILLATPPVPNPQFIQAQQALQQLQMEIQARQSAGVPASPEEIEQLSQMEQSLAKIPQEISSLPVDVETDDHAVEAEACREKINSPEGRKLRDGTAEERSAFQNLRLHYLDHKANIPAPPSDTKPPSMSINFKDLPPDPAAQLLEKAGLETSGSDVVQNREFTAEVKRSSKIGGPVLPGQS